VETRPGVKTGGTFENVGVHWNRDAGGRRRQNGRLYAMLEIEMWTGELVAVQ
jgi:hypothetical protein